MSVPLSERRCPNCNELAGPDDRACGRCGLPLPEIPRWGSGPEAARAGRFHSGRVTEDPTMPTIHPNATATGTPLGFSGPAFGAMAPQTVPAQVGAPVGALDEADLTQPGQPTPPGGLPVVPVGQVAPGVGRQSHPPVPSAPSTLAPRSPAGSAPPWMVTALGVLAALVLLEGIGLLVLFARPVAQALAPAATATSAPGVAPSPGLQGVLYQAKWKPGSFDGWSVNPNDQSGDWSAQDGRLVNTGQYTRDIGTAPSITAPANVLQGVKNYAIEATIEVLGAGPSAGFGFFVQYADGSPPSGYILGVSTAGVPLSQLRVSPAASWGSPRVKTIFSPGAARHVYRIEVRGGMMSFLVDGVAILEPPFDAGDASGSLFGLWDAQVRLVVSSFVVLKLP